MQLHLIVFEIRDIYLYECKYIYYLPMVRSRAHLLITLTALLTAHFMRALRTKSEVSQTTAADSSIAHTHCGRKGGKR